MLKNMQIEKGMVKILREKGEKVQSMQRDKGKVLVNADRKVKGLVNADRKGKEQSQRRQKREEVET